MSTTAGLRPRDIPSQELTRRTIVPRVPSIVFAVVFLFSIYQLGRTVSGGDTAWSVLTAAAFGGLAESGWQAHYYSATLALSALSALAIWKMSDRGTWRDAVGTGLALMLLFHTHWLSFLILTAVLLANVPLGLGRPRWVPKLLLTGAIAASGIVPWLYFTNFLEAARGTPMAWPLIAFPGDLVSWFVTRKAFMGAIGLILALALLPAAFPGHRFVRRVVAAADDRRAFYFTLTWLVIAYSAFIFLSPATDFATRHLTILLAVPGYLLFAMCVVTAARTLTPRFSVVVAPLVVMAFLLARGAVTFAVPRPSAPSGVEAFIDVASRWTLEAGTKIYAWPRENLLLTYVSGLPVQSVAPVRKAFLDQYPGDVIFVETGTAYANRPLTDVRTFTSQHGVSLSVEGARQAALRIQRHGARQYSARPRGRHLATFRTDGTDRSGVARHVRRAHGAGRHMERGAIPALAGVYSHEQPDRPVVAGGVLVRESREAPGRSAQLSGSSPRRHGDRPAERLDHLRCKAEPCRPARRSGTVSRDPAQCIDDRFVTTSEG